MKCLNSWTNVLNRNFHIEFPASKSVQFLGGCFKFFKIKFNEQLSVLEVITNFIYSNREFYTQVPTIIVNGHKELDPQFIQHVHNPKLSV